MIKNEREYRITKAAAEKFRAAITATKQGAPPTGVAPKLHTVSIDAMRSQLRDLEQEIRDYDQLRAGRPRLDGTVDDLGAILIRARVARGWTQRELGDRVGVKMQQIQQYEATDYASASLTRIREVFMALGASADVKATLVPLGGLSATRSAHDRVASGTSLANPTARDGKVTVRPGSDGRWRVKKQPERRAVRK